MDLNKLVRDVPDFPREGILFKDIAPLLRSAEAFSFAVDRMAEPFLSWGVENIVAVEARGFILGGPLAIRLNAGFIAIRKPGKLPMDIVRHEYQLEYGSDVLEIQKDAIRSGQKTLIVDDILATGGTLAAVASLLELAGADVLGATVLGEILALGGRGRLPGYRIKSVLTW